jgi:tungstate transport system substrate-binding protein
LLRLALALIAVWLAAGPVHAQPSQRHILVASTHTTQDSGLLSILGPKFTAATGIGVRFAIFGTGQALDVARRGDVDVVLSHLKADEERFVAEGYGVRRFSVMYNDFVLIGPQSDPARVAGEKDIATALRKLQLSRSPFISRGDQSGTHVMELSLWRRAGVDIEQAPGRWYRELGQGMGAALNMASSLDAYVLSDRGTWLKFRNRGQLAILAEGDRPLRNQYGVVLVNSQRHPNVKVADGQAFVDWLKGPDGQATISSYRINGEQVFFPNAGEPGS